MIFGFFINLFLVKQTYSNFYIYDKKSFLNLLELSGVLETFYFNELLEKVEKNNSIVNYVYKPDINKNNFSKYFNDKKIFSEWIVAATQAKFFGRKKNQERWETDISWINDKTKDLVYENLQKLAFTKEITFSKKNYQDVVIFGALYIRMEDRFLYLLDRLNSIKTNKITFLVGGDRVVNFPEKIKNCKTNKCLGETLSDLDENSEQKIYYKYAIENNDKNEKEFVMEFKDNITKKRITEKTMAELIIKKYKENLSKYNNIKIRILETKTDRPDAARANTGDTIKTLIKEDNITKSFKGYVFISNQPHVETQKLAVIKAFLEYYNLARMPKNLDVEVAGSGSELKNTRESLMMHTQTFAGTIFMKNSLNKYNKNEKY